MDLLLTGDIHIQIGAAREATLRRVLDFTVEEAERRAVAAVGVTGDWYHAASTEVDRLYSMELIGWGTQTRPWFIVDGNHDREFDTSILTRFATKHPAHVFGEPAAATIRTKDGPLLLAAFPDLRGTAIARRLDTMPKGTTREVAARAILQALGEELDTLAGIAEMQGEAPPRLFAGHLTLGGARMDNDQPARGADLTWPLADLRMVHAHAYALGHIHVRQTWSLDGRPVFYGGAPYATTYGDLGPRSITLLHWNGAGFDVEFISTPAPRLIHLVGTWCGDATPPFMSLAYEKSHEASIVVAAADLAGGDVRLQYPDPLADKEAAKRAAADHCAAILAAGAVRCEPDPRPIRVERTRTHALIGARTIGEKVVAYWGASNTAPDPERQARVLAHLTRMEALLPPEPPVSLLRVDKVEWSTIGPLAGGELTLPAGLHAVVGANRAGKSHLLALLTAGLWVDGPKGSLDKLGKRPGSRVKLAVESHSGAWTIEQKVPTGKVEVREAGVPVHDGGREPFYEWAEDHLPSPDVLGQVSFLKGNTLLDVVDARLKDALLVLGGSSKLSALAKIARAERDEADQRRMAAFAVVYPNAGNPSNPVRDPVADLAAVTARLAAARDEVDRLTGERVALAHAAEIAAARFHLDTHLRSVDSRRDAAAKKLSALMQAQGNASQIRAAAAAHTRAREARAAAEADVSRLTAEIGSLQRSIIELAEEGARATGRAVDTQARADRMTGRLAARADGEAAALALPEARARLLATEGALVLATKHTDAGQLRTVLLEIRQHASGSRLKQSISVLDAALVKIRDMADAALADVGPKETIAAVMGLRDNAARVVADLEARVRSLADLDAVAAERDLALATVEEEQTIAMILCGRERDLAEELPTLESSKADAGRRYAEADAAVREHAALAAQLADVDRAAGAITALDEQVRTLEEEFYAARAALDTAPTTNINASKGRRAEIDRALTAATRDAARWEEVRTTRQEAVDRLNAAREKLAVAERDEGDLTEAARVVDRDAVQAYEAGAVGEAIADDASDLLARHGFRWSIRFDATRPTKSKRYVEQARWTIVDGATGEEYDARADGGGASDGEDVIAATAISLGAAIGVVRRGFGVPDATMAIDERAGAIRGDLVEQWLAMLRDGAARAGVRTILLVPPNDQRLIDACDGVITVVPTETGSVLR